LEKLTRGTVSNLKLDTVNLTGLESVGALAGSFVTGTVTNVHAKKVVINSTHWAGGLVGYSYASYSGCSVENVTVTLVWDTTAEDNGDKAGGMVGYQAEGSFTFTDCTATNVDITGVRDVGGLVGAVQYGNTFTNCHVFGGTVTADDTSRSDESPWAGGLLGRAAGSPIYIINSSVTGVTVSSYDPAFAGPVVGGPLSNVTFYVHNVTKDTWHATIQAAIDAASDGDTINVAAGTYDEENILITKGLTLQGAGAANTFIAPSSTTDNSTIIVRNPSGDVTINGFNFVMQPKVNYGSAVVVTGATIDIDSATVTISNNVVTGSDNGAKSDYGFYGQGNNAKIVITGNTINKTGDNPIVMEQQFGSSTVENNTFYITASPDYDAYYSMVYSGKTISTPQIVQNNVFHLAHDDSGYSQAISFTTAVLNAWGGQPSDTGYYTNIQILNNTIYTEGPFARGIGLNDRSSALGNGTITGAVVTGNKIIGEAATDAETYGITLRGDIRGAVIQNNEISNVNLGFRVQMNLDSGTTLICSSGTDFSLNKVTSVTIAAQNIDCTDVNVDASPNWWGHATGPAAGEISGSVNTTPWYATATTTPQTEKVTVKRGDIVVAFSDTIQGAIDAASDGDTINVSPGTYAEALELRTPNITVKSTAGAETTILDVPFGTLTTGVKVLANMGTVTFDGFTVKNFTESGIIQGMAAREGTTFHVLNNVVLPYIPTDSTPPYLRNGIQVSGDGSTVKGNFVEGAYLTPTWASTGILVVNASNVVVENNVVDATAYGMDYAIGVANWSGTVEMTNVWILGNTIVGADYPLDVTAYAGTIGTGIVINNNKVTEYIEPLWAGINGGISVATVDATHNWWGSPYGPQGAVTGDVEYSPWCGDAACETLMPDEDGVIDLTPPEGGEPPEPEEIQNAINNAPSGSTIVIPEGEYAQVGAFVVSKPNLTIKLSDGTVIQNSSPCFVVNASYTQILAEPGAKCIPTEGSNGIDVAADLTDIRVKGLEIDGSGQTTGDGIHFAGVVNGTVLVDNKIHDLGGDGIEFVESPTGTVDIHGNLFAFNGGDGINNSDTTSPTVVAAEYNSWGSYYGPTGEGGDGISANVDADPYTYGDFWMSSSDSPWADQVVKGQTITYTIKALVKEVNAADVTFTYPEGLTVTASQAIVTKFESGTLEHDTGTRTFTYVGMSTNGNENETVDLFSVTFTASATMSDAVMDIFEGSFGMAGVGSSSNVYVQGIDDGSITVIDLPTLTSTTIAGPYLAGIPQYFFMTATNPTTGGDFVNSIYYVFTIANTLTTDIDSLSCNSIAVSLQQSGDDVVGRVGWKDAGYTLEHGENWENTCNIKFKTPKDYLFTVNMVDNTTDVPADDIPLTSLTETAVVNGNFAITGTFSMQGRVTRGGIPVTLTWLEPGWDYAASADTEDLLVNNFQVTVTYGGSYRITTNQPRYLNVPGATPAVSKTMTLPDLYLYGGNANGDNAIGIGDASVVGGAYGTGNIESDGDVNFDNRVNIQDLALVGGNYGLTDEVYNDWLQ